MLVRASWNFQFLFLVVKMLCLCVGNFWLESYYAFSRSKFIFFKALFG